MLVLRAAAQVVEGIQRGLAEDGFTDVRPAHGFAFVRISAGDATVVEVAAYLGITKQGGSQLVEQLVQRGYVTRHVGATDRRSKLLRLTGRGRACTRAAERAAGDTTQAWRREVGDETMAALHAALSDIVVPGRLRPAW